MMKRSVFEKIELAFFYLIILFILREWLLPIMQLTKTGYFMNFMLFIVICLTIGVFSLPIVISWPIKILYITWFITSVYNTKGELTTWQFLSKELRYNVDVLLSGDWILVSDPLRTSLFFILIWMLIYLIQHWISVRHTIFYFLVVTVIFIGVLDTFTAYNGSTAIMKVMILGLVLTSLLFIKRLMIRANMQKDWASYVLFATPIIVLVTIAGVTASLLPKAEPQWPDPVPYMKSVVGIGNNTVKTIATVGYGENDEQLGGPFVGDNTVVYEIETPIRQYWRVETKDYYTSKGWVKTDDASNEFLIPLTEKIPFSITPGDTEQMVAEVHSMSDYDFLLQSYGTMGYLSAGGENTVRFNEITEKLRLWNGQVVTPTAYNIIFQQPEYSFTALREVTTSTGADPRYTQLPGELPQRVIDLAHEITDGHESIYNKARAIENYFARSGYTYETTNVAIPEGDEDYVDQFLFETKMGYCDNYSTSMVVMLRAVGVQARWVKGFAAGERVASNADLTTYHVTNNDAHSWVEVYIDSIGWMPFEPTVGFSNPTNINYDLQSAPAEEQLPDMEEQEIERPEPEEQEVLPTASQGMTFDFAKYRWVLYVLLVALLLAAIILWKKRGTWQPKLIIQMNRSKLKDANNFEDAYLILLKQLERIYLKRDVHETLQQFAKRVDTSLDTTKMSELTAVYEQHIYAGQLTEFNASEIKESWEYLINRTSS